MTYEPWGNADISEDGRYRYRLQRRWGPVVDRRGWLRIVMLNPSTADSFVDDPTIRRCIGFAKREGYNAIAVYNLYAFRATDPKQLVSCEDPIGPDNNFWLRDGLTAAKEFSEPVLAAWGANAQPERAATVLDLVPGVDWRCLGTTKSGAPKHPLYIAGTQPLVPLETP